MVFRKLLGVCDMVLVSIGLLTAFVDGAVENLLGIILGSVFDLLLEGKVLEGGRLGAVLFCAWGVSSLICRVTHVGLLSLVSEKVGVRLRVLCLDKVARSELAWLDTHKTGTLSTQMLMNIAHVKKAVGPDAGQLFRTLGMAICGFIVGFLVNWKLAFLVVGFGPLMSLGLALLVRGVYASAEEGMVRYEEAGQVAEDAMSKVRTVKSLQLERHFSDLYRSKLNLCRKEGIKGAISLALGSSWSRLMFEVLHAVMFYVGALLIVQGWQTEAEAFPPSASLASQGCAVGTILDAKLVESLDCPFYQGRNLSSLADVCSCTMCACGCEATGACLTPGNVLTVLLCVMNVGNAAGSVASYIQSIVEGVAAGGKLFAILDDKSGSSGDEKGKTKLQDTEVERSTTSSAIELPQFSRRAGQVQHVQDWSIQLEHVSFAYETRKTEQVLQNFSLTIASSEMVGFVGASGCGKSTISLLIMGFYQPSQGNIRIGGVDLNDLDRKWFRSKIGYVQQEPILFTGTIKENIAFGMSDHVPIQAEIEKAAEDANVLPFIQSLRDGFDTFVGNNGQQLSAGQRQRIALARALIRKPSLLVLDEPTSALDGNSEKRFQEAIRTLREQPSPPTMITIMHNLSSLREVDRIIVLERGGRIVEQGSHDQLLGNPQGLYKAMWDTAGHDDIDVTTSSQQQQQDTQDSQSESESGGVSDSSSTGHRYASSSANVGSIRYSQLGKETEEELQAKRKRGKEEKKRKKTEDESSLSRLFAYSRKERGWYVGIVIGAALEGLEWPVFFYFLGIILDGLYSPTEEKVMETAKLGAIIFSLIGFFCGLGVVLVISSYGIVRENMLFRLRDDMFQRILAHEISFFETNDPEQAPLALAGKLASDPVAVRQVLGGRLHKGTTVAVNVLACLVISFVAGWQLTLAIVAMLPLIVLGGVFISFDMFRQSRDDLDKESTSFQIFSQVLYGARTVKAFGLEDRLVQAFVSSIRRDRTVAVTAAVREGALHAFVAAIIKFIQAFGMYYGTRLMVEQPENYSFQSFVQIFLLTLTAGIETSNSLYGLVDVATAKAALHRIFSIIDGVPPSHGTAPFPHDDATAGFNLALDHVSFSYPSEPSHRVLKDISLSIGGRGKTVALVGGSGSGKSTIASLLLRFYEPTSGLIRVNDRGLVLRDVSVKSLRAHTAMVEQEPKLFGTTIFENIALGARDGMLVTQELVQNAAKAADIHEFIQSLEHGYQTEVGGGHTMLLSVGQKQRICIARALLREPDILILDEATSALDNISERAIQTTLENYIQGKRILTVMIAHRLSTIRRADNVVCLQSGQVVEQGTFSELMADSASFFAELYRLVEHEQHM